MPGAARPATAGPSGRRPTLDKRHHSRAPSPYSATAATPSSGGKSKSGAQLNREAYERLHGSGGGQTRTARARPGSAQVRPDSSQRPTQAQQQAEVNPEMSALLEAVRLRLRQLRSRMRDVKATADEVKLSGSAKQTEVRQACANMMQAVESRQHVMLEAVTQLQELKLDKLQRQVRSISALLKRRMTSHLAPSYLLAAQANSIDSEAQQVQINRSSINRALKYLSPIHETLCNRCSRRSESWPRPSVTKR